MCVYCYCYCITSAVWNVIVCHRMGFNKQVNLHSRMSYIVIIAVWIKFSASVYVSQYEFQVIVRT